MIRNIVFDMGQVLIQWRPDVMAARTGAAEEDRPLLVKRVFGSVEWIQLDRGSISKDEALEAMCRNLPERLHPCAGELVRGWWKHPLLPVPGMAELIGQLKGRGYGIYLLSNASVDLPAFFPRIPGSQYFDGRIVSADWKLLKPQPEIYETLFREYRLKREECFFIDDLTINIEGARHVGMDGLVFEGDLTPIRSRFLEASAGTQI